MAGGRPTLKIKKCMLLVSFVRFLLHMFAGLEELARRYGIEYGGFNNVVCQYRRSSEMYQRWPIMCSREHSSQAYHVFGCSYVKQQHHCSSYAFTTSFSSPCWCAPWRIYSTVGSSCWSFCELHLYIWVWCSLVLMLLKKKALRH